MRLRKTGAAMRKEWFEDVMQATSVDPGFRSLEEIAAMGPVARRKYDRARFRFLKAGAMINTVAAARIFAGLQACLQADETGVSEANDMLLLSGPPGVGKSKIANTVAVWWYYECIYDEAEEAGVDAAELMESIEFVPIVRITLPGAVTPRELFELICEFLDHPVAVSISQLRIAAQHALIEAGTRLLIIDEVQALRFEGKSSRDTHNTLRHLVNISSLTLLLVGHNMVEVLDKRLEDGMAETARQMSRGRMTDFEIGPFRHGTQELWDEWVGVLEILELRFRLANSDPGWLSTRYAEWVYQTTLGHFKPLISLLTRANALAISSGTEAITLDLLKVTPIERMTSASREKRIAMLERDQWHFIDPAAS